MNGILSCSAKLSLFILCVAVELGGVMALEGQDLSWWFTREQRAQMAKPKIEPVDINRASVGELERIPGMTPIWAKRIVRFRPYSNKYALRLEGVLPGRIYDQVKPYLVAHREK